MRTLNKLFARIVDGGINRAQIALERFAHARIPARLALLDALHQQFKLRIARRRALRDRQPRFGRLCAPETLHGKGCERRDADDERADGGGQLRQAQQPTFIEHARDETLAATGDDGGDLRGGAPLCFAFGFNRVTDAQPQSVATGRRDGVVVRGPRRRDDGG